jgi:hypothetical protein
MTRFWAGTTKPQLHCFALFITALSVTCTAVAEAPKGGTIGYVLTHKAWVIYEADGVETQCPQGLNASGVREQFAELFPMDSDKEWTVLESRLMREGRMWHPETSSESFPYYEAQGEIAYGLNLDGKVDADDYRNPDGIEGVDNQLQRALGCTPGWRSDGQFVHFESLFAVGHNYNRWMIELSGVDNLVNDDEVTVTTYRGLDDLFTDATGEGFMAGGSQRVDARWGQSFISQTTGKIVDGVLTTEPIKKAKIPWAMRFVGHYDVFDFQLKLELTPKAANGIFAGYVGVDNWNNRLNRNWGTHHQSYGTVSAASEYRAMRRLADAYPDPETGANTAISGAAEISLTQVYIIHPDD